VIGKRRLPGWREVGTAGAHPNREAARHQGFYLDLRVKIAKKLAARPETARAD